MKLLAMVGTLVAASIGSASASIITYNTAGSAFTCPSCTTNTGSAITIAGPTAGDLATITYTGPGPGPGNVSVNSPSNISYGFFTLSYVGVPTDTIGVPAFTFSLVVHDVTDGTTAAFNGTSSASSISANSSTVGVVWSPTTLPNGGAIFTITSPTLLPSDNTLAGQASIQGTVTNSTPEPGSMFLLGAGLIGVGLTARKKLISRS